MPAPVRRLLTAAVVVVLGALALGTQAFARGGGAVPVEPASPNAEDIATSYWLVLAITGVIFVLVEGALIVFVVRYRRAGRPRDGEAPQIHGHTRLEVIWTIVPVLILAVIVAFVFALLPGIEDVPSAEASGEEEITVEVVGRQFYWQFRYPDGSITYDTLIAPVGRVVELEVTAPQEDVIHSWWIPSLGGKFDAIPGETTHTWFRAQREGVFQGQCAEFCGIQHASMLGQVRVVSQSAWEARLAAAQERLGASAFQSVCAKCHNLAGPILIGPSLRGNSILTNREQLEDLLRNGRGEMPAVGRDWTDEQLDALAEHVAQYGAAGGG
jgi:cytochrome c oxidase subunit 2